MKKFSDVFNDWIIEKTHTQIEIIEELSIKFNIDSKEWFDSYLKNKGDFSGTDILNNMLEYFAAFISKKIEFALCKYLDHSVIREKYFYNELESNCDIYASLGDNKEPLMCFYIDLYGPGNYFRFHYLEEFQNLYNQLKTDQKVELQKDIIFKTVLEESKTPFFNKKDERFLKLKKIKND